MSEKFHNKYRVNSARLKHWDYGWNAAYFVTICAHNRVYFFGDVVNGKMVLNKIGEIANDCWLNIPNHFPFAKLGCNIVMPNHIHGIVWIDKQDDGRNASKNDARIVSKNDARTVETPKLGVSTANTNAPNITNALYDAPTVQTPKLGVSTTNTNDTPNSTNALYDARTVETPNLGVSTTNINNTTNTNNSDINDTPNTRNKTHGASEKWKPGTLGVIMNQYKRAVTIRARKINADFAWQSRYHDHIIRDDKSFYRISEYIINNPLNWSDDQ